MTPKRSIALCWVAISAELSVLAYPALDRDLGPPDRLPDDIDSLPMPLRFLLRSTARCSPTTSQTPLRRRTRYPRWATPPASLPWRS